MQSTNDDQVFLFGEFMLDPLDRTLRLGDTPVPIQDKPLDLLIYLIRNRGRVVSRDEVLREVWPDVAVGHQALRFAIHAARAAVGDDGRTQGVLKTFPGKGIQFVPAVKTKHRVGSGRTWNVMPFLHRERLDGETRNALSSVSLAESMSPPA